MNKECEKALVVVLGSNARVCMSRFARSTPRPTPRYNIVRDLVLVTTYIYSFSEVLSSSSNRYHKIYLASPRFAASLDLLSTYSQA